ncbi:hypothetical protein BH23PLA1_BH23PLA1_08680 [soil metagenome]
MLEIYVIQREKSERYTHDGGPLAIGREPRRLGARPLVIEPTNRSVGRDQLLVEELPSGFLRLENLHRSVEVLLVDQPTLGPGELRECKPPVLWKVGSTRVEIDRWQKPETERTRVQSVDPPVQLSVCPSPPPLSRSGETPEAGQLVRWLEALVTVQRSAASSPDFYAQTARAVVELIGMDRGLVLLKQGEGWEIAASQEADPEAIGSASAYSRTILKQVCQERRTLYWVPEDELDTESRPPGGDVVAAPILSDDGRNVVGAVYGVRSRRSTPIRPLEAQFMQVLAAAVGSGLARLREENRHRQLLDFFSPELIDELDRNPGLLEGKNREVTILFSDIRGFSRISEKFDSAEQTCELVRDVMEQMTRRIVEYQGVVVDYIGDAILALWNAPAPQPDHAYLACRAALAMLSELPELNRRWADRIGFPLELGIGLNTGEAMVGNTGSHSRLKYGPLGHAVNLASRVEGATKQIGVPVLITGTTQASLGPHGFATRRLCKAAVVGIQGPVDLYELRAEAIEPGWQARRDVFEIGLRLDEAGDWAEACRTLYPLMASQQGHYDRPTLTLVGRSIECLKTLPSPFDPVFKLDVK